MTIQISLLSYANSALHSLPIPDRCFKNSALHSLPIPDRGFINSALHSLPIPDRGNNQSALHSLPTAHLALPPTLMELPFRDKPSILNFSQTKLSRTFVYIAGCSNNGWGPFCIITRMNKISGKWRKKGQRKSIVRNKDQRFPSFNYEEQGIKSLNAES